MFRSFWQAIRRTINRHRQVEPLVPLARDLELVRQIHGRPWPRLRQLRHLPKILSARERQLIRLCWLLFIAGALWLGGVLVMRYRVAVPAVGGTYIEAVIGSPQLVNPIFAPVNDVDQDLTRLIFSGLMRYDERQELVPDLAESVEVSADKKTYTFTLRPDALWHDGSLVTTADVLFTIQTIQNPLVNSPLLVSFQGVEVSAPNERQVQFVLKEPFAPFLASLTVGILPEHVWFGVPPERMRFHRQNIQPVGTGPFMFKKLTKDETGFIHTYELVRFDRFYRPAYLQAITFRFFTEFDGPTGALQALRSQRVDGLSFVPHDLRERAERKHLTLHTLQLPQYTALFFNQDKQPALKQSAVRQALAEGLHKERILRQVLRDEGQNIHSPILPGFPGYKVEAGLIAYDPTAANDRLDKLYSRLSAEEYRRRRTAELIRERTASVSTTLAVGEAVVTSSLATSSPEVIATEVTQTLAAEINAAQTFYRQDKDGQILSLRLVTANTPEYQQAAGLIAGFWQELGIRTRIELVDPKDIARTTLRTRDYDILLYGMILGSDPDQFPFWHSTQVDFPGLNLARYVNRNADALLEKMRSTNDPAELASVSEKFQELIFKDQPAVFLYMPTYTYATHTKVKGIDVVRIFHPADRFVNVTEWYTETKGRWKFGNTRTFSF